MPPRKPANPSDSANRTGAGALFRVTCATALPGSAPSWTVLVRAVDAETAGQIIQSRGHRVLAIIAADASAPVARSIPRLKCQVCGYVLHGIPPDQLGNITCPECSVINPSISPYEQAKADRQSRPRRRKRSLWRAFVLLVLIITPLLIILLSR